MNTLVRAQLSAITEVLNAANELGIEVWLRGGWAMDFYLGQITREHGVAGSNPVSPTKKSRKLKGFRDSSLVRFYPAI